MIAEDSNTLDQSVGEVVDGRNGKIDWEEEMHRSCAHVAISNGLLFVADFSGLVHCIDAKTGVKKWTFETSSEIIGGASFAGDNVLFGSYDSTLYCLDNKGKKLWEYLQRTSFTTSAMTTAGGLVFIGDFDRNVKAFDFRTGKVLWQSRGPTGASGHPAKAHATIAGGD